MSKIENIKIAEMPLQATEFLTSQKYMSLSEVCEFLSISRATAKNWIKLNKIVPYCTHKKQYYFARDCIEKMLNNICSDKTTILKSRRNKKKQIQLKIYKNYIDNQNLVHALDVLLAFEDAKFFNNDEVRVILSNFALQSFAQKFGVRYNSNNLVELFIQKKISFGKIDRLITDLLPKELPAMSKLGKILDMYFVHKLGQDNLGFSYLSLRTMAERKVTGSYYTPLVIAKKLIEKSFEIKKIENSKILDPCCGTGNFLILMTEKDADIKHLYGMDVDSISVLIARINLALALDDIDIDILYKNIICADFLSHKTQEKYDIIIGNPPWGYAYNDFEKQELKDKFQSCSSNNIESYSLFIEKGISLLSADALLSFVLPESILNVKTHKAIRLFVAQCMSFCFVEYLGEVFGDVHCPSILLGMKKQSRELFQACSVSKKNNSFIISKPRDFINAEWSFNVTDEEYACLSQIKAVENPFTLKNNALFALGIVTGNNDNLLSGEADEGYEPILKGSDIKKYVYTSATKFIKFVPENFQQVAPEHIYRADEKIVYKFISKKLAFAYDNTQTLTLNSCNIIVPRIKNVHIKYILAILNSAVVQFFMQKTYNSVKILKSHLESIPMPLIKLEQQADIINIVNTILDTDSPQYLAEKHALLDEKIMQLYGLSKHYVQLINERVK